MKFIVAIFFLIAASSVTANNFEIQLRRRLYGSSSYLGNCLTTCRNRFYSFKGHYTESNCNSECYQASRAMKSMNEEGKNYVIRCISACSARISRHHSEVRSCRGRCFSQGRQITRQLDELEDEANGELMAPQLLNPFEIRQRRRLVLGCGSYRYINGVKTWMDSSKASLWKCRCAYVRCQSFPKISSSCRSSPRRVQSGSSCCRFRCYVGEHCKYLLLSSSF